MIKPLHLPPRNSNSAIFKSLWLRRQYKRVNSLPNPASYRKSDRPSVSFRNIAVVLLGLSLFSYLVFYQSTRSRRWLLSPEDGSVGLFGEFFHKPTTVTCTGQGLAEYCTLTNACVDHKGILVIGDSTLGIEKVNLVAIDEAIPLRKDGRAVRSRSYDKMKAKQVQKPRADTLFVYGTYAPYHFVHYIYNTLLPLWSMIQTMHASDYWLYQAYTHWGGPSRYALHDITFLSKHPVLIDKPLDYPVSTAETVTPYTPICFKRMVIGLGTRCNLRYCEDSVPALHSNQFRDQVLRSSTSSFASAAQQPEDHFNACMKRTKILTNNSTVGTKVVGLVSRARSRHLINLEETIKAIQSLPEVGTIKVFDFNKGCGLSATAKLLEDVDILIGSHGNSQGSSIFMKPNSLVVSIDTPNYNEWWFPDALTAIGRRFYSLTCSSQDCIHLDTAWATSVLSTNGITATTAEIQAIASYSATSSQLQAIVAKSTLKDKPSAGRILDDYAKDADRLVPIPQLITLVKQVLADGITSEHYYPDLCTNGKCCGGSACLSAMNRMVYSDRGAWQNWNTWEDWDTPAPTGIAQVWQIEET